MFSISFFLLIRWWLTTEFSLFFLLQIWCWLKMMCMTLHRKHDQWQYSNNSKFEILFNVCFFEKCTYNPRKPNILLLSCIHVCKNDDHFINIITGNTEYSMLLQSKINFYEEQKTMKYCGKKRLKKCQWRLQYLSFGTAEPRIWLQPSKFKEMGFRRQTLPMMIFPASKETYIPTPFPRPEAAPKLP